MTLEDWMFQDKVTEIEHESQSHTVLHRNVTVLKLVQYRRLSSVTHRDTSTTCGSASDHHWIVLVT
jgi:hypothetical protein